VDIVTKHSALLAWGLVAATLFSANPGGAAEPAQQSAAVAPQAKESPDNAAEPVRRSARLREGDEFWQLSTRHLCGATSEVARAIIVHQYEPANGQSSWKTSSLDEFIPSERECATVFFVHGNRESADLAVSQGWQLYDALAISDSVPFRLVVWSWPSEQMRGQLRDVRSKAARAGDEAYYFGWLLRKHSSTSKIGIVGYSLGAKIVTGGLHLAAGGELDGQTLDGQPPDAQNYGVVLAAAAAHNHWLMPDSRHGKALEQVDQLFNLYNSCDPVLKRYRLIDPCEKPVALGYTGIAPASLGPYADRVEQRDAASAIGKTHDESAYLYSGMTRDELRRYLLPALPAAK